MSSQPAQWVKLSNYAFKLWVEQHPFPKVVMGFDVGLKSTGVAITGSDLKHAFYLTTLKGELRSKPFLEKTTNLLMKEKPVGLVIGRPNYVIQTQNENIVEGIEDWIRQMALQHTKTSNYRYTFVDQSWTTLSAKLQLKAMQNQIKYWGHLRKQKDLIDGMAAINILRKYLDFYNKK